MLFQVGYAITHIYPYTLTAGEEEKDEKFWDRFFCALLSCVLLLGLCAGGTKALAEEALSGKCGQNLTWRFEPETGTLTITGEGAVWDYDNPSLTPWAAYSGDIKKSCSSPV